MVSIADNLAEVKAKIASAATQAARNPGDINLVAVSKTHPMDAIIQAYRAGQRVFGENKVQEAMAKWPPLLQKYNDIELHLVGALQSNKVKQALELFDVLNIDREKIARRIADLAGDRQPRLFIQVNTGDEVQKAGISPQQIDGFLSYVTKDLGLTIDGLMAIGPQDEEPALTFALLAKITQRLELKHLNMGMSGDYPTAIAFGSTIIRVGTAIFGPRQAPIASD